MSHLAPARRLLALLYLVGVIILIDQLADVAATILLQPVASGTANWRVAVFGLVASRASIFLIADVLCIVAAVGLEHRRVLRLFSVVHGGLALAVLIGVLLFSLDAVEVLRTVRPAARSAFVAAAARAVTVALVGLLLLAWASVAGWRASRPPHRKGRSGPDSLLVPMSRDTGDAK